MNKKQIRTQVLRFQVWQQIHLNPEATIREIASEIGASEGAVRVHAKQLKSPIVRDFLYSQPKHPSGTPQDTWSLMRRNAGVNRG